MIRGKSAKVEQLAEVLVLKDLPTSNLIALQAHTTIYSYFEREVVVFEGDRLQTRLYILLQGSLQLTRMGTTGKETIIRTLSPNEIFAAPALVGNAIAPATITALLRDF
jgi:CRP/FNR family transcriptional regulator, cyclic AMP receptor protein